MTTMTSTRRCLALAAAIVFAAMVAAVPASAADRNHDNIPDKWEKKHGLSLNKNQAKRDQDGDKLRNRGEFEASMNPHDSDSDDDSVEDGDEGAGTIASYDSATGELVINVFNGTTISGTVTDDTEIECESDDVDEPDDDNSGHDDGDVEDEDIDDDSHGGPGHDRAKSGDDDGPSGDEGPGHEIGDDDCDGAECTAADLTVDRVVREASLDLTPTGLVYDEIELG